MSISRLLGTERQTEASDRSQILDLECEEANDVFDALSSETARVTLNALYDEPQTASELANRLEQSIQNVKYHLENLQDADLIEVGAITYSDTGNEMKVYEPTGTAVVLVSSEGTKSRLQSVISQVLGAVILLGIAVVALRQLFVDIIGPRLLEEPGTDDSPFSLESADADMGITAEDPGLWVQLLTDPAALILSGMLVALVVVGVVWTLRWRLDEHEY